MNSQLQEQTPLSESEYHRLVEYPPEKPRMRAVLRRIDGGRVLHVGCVGHGAYQEPDTDWLHEHLYYVADEVVGVDIDEEGVRDLQADGWDVRVDDATELTSIGEDVDVVVAGEVIEHLSAPGELFAATRRVLKDDGRLLVTTPNPWAVCYIARVLRGTDPVGNDEHTCWIDATTLRELAYRYGFSGAVEYIKPMSYGLSHAMYHAGRKRLGGTRILGDFRMLPDQ